MVDDNVLVFSYQVNCCKLEKENFVYFIYLLKHQRQRAQATSMPSISIAVNIYMLDNETRVNDIL